MRREQVEAIAAGIALMVLLASPALLLFALWAMGR